MTDRLPTTPTRRFNLGDLVITIAAAATLFALLHYSEHNPDDQFDLSPGGSLGTIYRITAWYEMAGSGLMIATLTLIVFRLRQPRPRWRRLMKQPGWVACLAASLASAMTILIEPIQHAIGYYLIATSLGGNTRPTSFIRWVIFSGSIARSASLAVAIVWIVLWIEGRWRAERAWVDRTGRAIGILWLLTPLANIGLQIRLLVGFES